MKVLMIGDIYGRPGRNVTKKILPKLKEKEKIDLAIANGENLAGGVGMTLDTYQEMIDAGIDLFTSGNHIFDKKDFIPCLDDKKIRVIRPINYPENVPGRGVEVIKTAEGDVAVVNLMGTVFMRLESIFPPFPLIEKILDEIKQKIILIDFHAEATAEKKAMGIFLDGKISALIGTHTHIATADAMILPKGTAYITDVGMVGTINSVIGTDSQIIIERFKSGLPLAIEVARGDCVFEAVIIDVDKDGKAKDIKLIREKIKA